VKELPPRLAKLLGTTLIDIKDVTAVWRSSAEAFCNQSERKPHMAEAATKLTVKTEDKKPEEKGAATLRPFESLRREIDRLFDDFEWGSWRSPFRRALFDVEPFLRGEVKWGKVPAVDVADTATNYEITAELPGLDEKDIEVKFFDGTLTIRGEKKEEKEEKKKDYYLSERHYGSFQRSFKVPDGVDPEKVEAAFKNGVLTVTLPKTAEAQKKVKKIEVKKA
jgi:HSP20 family protein